MTSPFAVGQVVIWRALVSNYGHVQEIPAVVVSVGPKRVRIETRWRDGVKERQINVKPENLVPAALITLDV